MLRPTVVYSFGRVLSYPFVLSFRFGYFGCLVVFIFVSGSNPDEDDAVSCAISGVGCIAFSIFFLYLARQALPSVILLFAFGFIPSGSSRSCRFCASSLMLSIVIVSLSSIVVSFTDAVAFVLLSLLLFVCFDGLITLATVSGT